MKFLLFSRHKFTDAQMEEINLRLNRYEECMENRPEVVDLTYLASRNITSLEDAKAIFQEIMEAVKGDNAELYGVIPTPLRHIFNCETYKGSSLSVMESFNINRAVEGEKPSFEHNGWLCTGYYYFG